MPGCKAVQPKSELWISGLSLPPGSTVVSKEQESAGSQATLYVGFNNPDGWATVEKHFEGQAAKLGYSNHFKKLEADLIRKTGRSMPASISGEPTIMYEKDGAAYGFSISDAMAMFAHGVSKAEASEMVKQSGAFSLLVVKLK
jgi:hypothetical protein